MVLFFWSTTPFKPFTKICLEHHNLKLTESLRIYASLITFIYMHSSKIKVCMQMGDYSYRCTINPKEVNLQGSITM